MHVSVPGSGVTHHIVVASRMIPAINVTPCEPLATRSSHCSDPDLEVHDADSQPWDTATTLTVDSVTQSSLGYRMNPPSLIFIAKPNPLPSVTEATIATSGAEATVVASGSRIGSPVGCF